MRKKSAKATIAKCFFKMSIEGQSFLIYFEKLNGTIMADIKSEKIFQYEYLGSVALLSHNTL